MANTAEVKARIVLLNKTTAEWAAETQIPIKATPCLEFTIDGKVKIKIGDGVHQFKDLKYITDDLTASTVLDAIGYTPIDSSKIGTAEGVASLDATGKVPVSQLPSFVDDVVEADGIDNAPATGEKDKIYVDTITNKTYRWSGTAYVEISASDIVTASEQNGYIKINGTDVKVYEPAIDDALSETSENAVQNKAVYAKFASIEADITGLANDKISKDDTLVLNCTM